MQGLWSRAPSAHGLCSSCRRRLCFGRIPRASNSSSRIPTQPAQAVHTRVMSRRPSPSSMRTARRKKVGAAADVFTALYATIVATAAVADADYKDRRQRDLDQRLTDARQDLARVLRESQAADYSLAMDLLVDPALGASLAQTVSPTTAAAPRPSTLPSPYHVVEGLYAVCVSPDQLRRDGAASRQNEAYLTWLHAQFGLSRRWWSQRPPPRGGLPAVEAAVFAEEEQQLKWKNQRRGLGQREPRSPLQFARMVESADRLVNDLMAEANRLGYPGDPEGARRATESLASPWHNIRLLRSEGYPNYRLPDLDPDDAAEARFAANTAARRIFDDWRSTRRAVYAEDGAPMPTAEGVSDPAEASALARHWYARHIKHWVGKLCHNLLVCTAPPSIHMYNVLLHGFASVGCPSLGDVVVRSFFHDTHLQPTQQTFVCLLHHYRAQGDLVGFYGMLRRFIGLDSRGAKIRRRTAVDVAEAALRSRGRDSGQDGNDLFDHHDYHDFQYHRQKLRQQRHYSEIHAWARTHDVALAADYVVQRAAIDVPLLDAILTGLLSLGQVRHAAFVFAAFLADCSQRLAGVSFPSAPDPSAPLPATAFSNGSMVIGVDAGRLNRFINCVLDAVDIPAARALLRGFSENVSLITPLLLSEERYGRKLAVKIRLLLSVAAAPEPLRKDWDDEEEPKTTRYHNDAALGAPHGSTVPVSVPSRSRGPVSVNRTGQAIGPRNRTGSRSATTDTAAGIAPAPPFSRPDNGTIRLASALFVADTQQYLTRLSQILAAAHRALLATAEGEGSPSALATARPLSVLVTPWTIQLENLKERPHRRGREEQLYRRMARLKALDETVAALVQAVTQLQEAVLETIVEGVGGVRTSKGQAADLDAAGVEDSRREKESSDAVDDCATVVYTTEGFDEATDNAWFEDEADCAQEEEPWQVGSALLPRAYRDFLRQASVPFAVRFASYLEVVAPRVLTTKGGPIAEAVEPAGAGAAATTVAAVDTGSDSERSHLSPAPLPSHLLDILERHVLVDALAVGAALEDRLRRVLAQSYRDQQQRTASAPETETPSAWASDASAAAGASPDLSLDALLTVWARQKRRREEALEQQKKAMRPLGFVARYRNGLRGALPGW